jgi:hypothetical protein
VAEHPLQRQIADALWLDLALPGVLSRLAPAVVARGEVSYDCRWTGRRGQIECVGCSSGAVTERPD